VGEVEKQKEIEEVIQGLASATQEVIKDLLGEMGFAILVFEFNRPGISHYVSNAERADMIDALRETADRLEKKQDIPPAHTTIQ